MTPTHVLEGRLYPHGQISIRGREKHPMDPNGMVPILSLNEPTTAEILKSALENEGIPCEIEGESQGGFAGVLQIRLFVRSEDAERARDFLREHHEVNGL